MYTNIHTQKRVFLKFTRKQDYSGARRSNESHFATLLGDRKERIKIVLMGGEGGLPGSTP